MRPIAAALALILLAGCASAPQGTRAPHVAAPLAGGWALDCAIGPASLARAPAWTQACMANAAHTPRTKAETWVAVNPADPRNVIIGSKDMDPAKSGNCVWNGERVTHDAGRTWKDITIGGNYSDRKVGDPFYGYACNTDAMFAFSKNGDVHFGVEMYNVASGAASAVTDRAGILPAGWKILLATSHDGGDTWPDVITYQPDILLVSDYSRMAVSPTSGAIIEAINVAAALRDDECHILVSRDGGKTADPPMRVTVKEDAPGASAANGQTSPSGAVCRGIAVDPKSGVVVLGWKDDYDQATHAYFSRSSDDARTFLDSNTGFTYKSIPDPFDDMKAPSRAGQQFELKFAPDGTLWVITAEAPNGDPNVYVRHSEDDGKTWSDPVQVNDLARGREQWMPQLAFGADGSLHAFFFDRGYASGHDIDITHAISLDRGATWTSERVTTTSWDPDLGKHQSGDPWIGDYNGADAVGNDVWAGFPDTSLGGEPTIAAVHVHRG